MGVVRLCKVSASYLILAAIACVIFCSLLPAIFTVTASGSLLWSSIYDYHVFCAVYMLPLFVVSYIHVICVYSICI